MNQRKSLVSHLEQINHFEAKPTFTTPNINYYTKVTRSGVPQLVREIEAEYSTPEAVLAKNKKNQNALHFILSGNMYNRSKSYSLLATTEARRSYTEQPVIQLADVIKATLSAFKPEKALEWERFEYDQASPQSSLVKKLGALFKAQDDSGNTPLHCALASSVDIDQLELILEQVTRLELKDQETLLTLRGSDGQTIINLTASKFDESYFMKLLDNFNNKALRNTLGRQDNLGNTVLHYLCLSPIGDALTKLEAFAQLEDKSFSVREIILKRNTTKQNILHIICKRPLGENVKLLKNTMAFLEKSHLNLLHQYESLLDALSAQDSDGFNPLHYACLSGDSDRTHVILFKLKYITQLIQTTIATLRMSPASSTESVAKVERLRTMQLQIVEILTKKTNSGQTPLKLICLHGNSIMLQEIIEQLSHMQNDIAYYLDKNEFFNLIEKNDHSQKLTKDDYISITESITILRDIFNYLERHYDKLLPDHEKHLKRRKDFAQCIINIFNEEALPEINISFFAKEYNVLGFKFKGSAKYAAFRQILNDSVEKGIVSQRHIDTFISYLRRMQGVSEVARGLLTIFDKAGIIRRKLSTHITTEISLACAATEVSKSAQQVEITKPDSAPIQGFLKPALLDVKITVPVAQEEAIAKKREFFLAPKVYPAINSSSIPLMHDDESISVLHYSLFGSSQAIEQAKAPAKNKSVKKSCEPKAMIVALPH